MKVLTDDRLCDALARINGPVEIRDAAGRTYGYYHPALHTSTRERSSTASPFSDDELERRRQRPGGRSLSEIWRDLGAS